MRRTLAACTAIAAVAAVAPAAAAAAPASILGGDPNPMATNANVFLPTAYEHEAGTVATLTWVAGGAHDADATGTGPDGGPLFRTELTRAALPVPGTQFLPLGAYPFVCTIHSGMTANLNVSSGVPLARPQVKLKLKSTKVEQVVSSSKLKVQATFAAPVPDVEATVEVKLGKRTIATGAASATRTLALKISKKDRKRLAEMNKVTLKLGAEVDFAAPTSAKGTLK